MTSAALQAGLCALDLRLAQERETWPAERRAAARRYGELARRAKQWGDRRAVATTEDAWRRARANELRYQRLARTAAAAYWGAADHQEAPPA